MANKCEEFLNLYQLCLTAKRCAGEGCPNVSQQAMEQARLLDKTRDARPET